MIRKPTNRAKPAEANGNAEFPCYMTAADCAEHMGPGSDIPTTPIEWANIEAVDRAERLSREGFTFDRDEYNARFTALQEADRAVYEADKAIRKAKQAAMDARTKAKDAAFDWLVGGQGYRKDGQFELSLAEALVMAEAVVDVIAFSWDEGDDLTDKELKSLSIAETMLANYDLSQFPDAMVDRVNDVLDIITEVTDVFR